MTLETIKQSFVPRDEKEVLAPRQTTQHSKGRSVKSIRPIKVFAKKSKGKGKIVSCQV